MKRGQAAAPGTESIAAADQVGQARQADLIGLLPPIRHIALIAALGAVLYVGTLGYPLLFDDEAYISRNPLIRGLTALSEGGGGLELPRDVGTTRSTRAVGYLTFTLNYIVHGIHPWGYHAVNVLIHVACALAVYMLTSLMLPGWRGGPALAAAMLFAAHPLQTGAVTYVSQRFASLATLFYVLSLVLYVHARIERVWGRRAIFYSLSIVSAILAMKTKETAFTLPIMVAACEFAFIPDRAMAGGGPGGALRGRIVALIPFALLIPIVPYGVLSAGGLDLSSGLRTQQEIPLLTYMLTEPRVLLTYLRLLALPVNQTLDYGYPLIERAGGAATPALALIGIMGLGACMLRQGGALRVAGFGVLWFFVTLMVESGPVALADVIFEHRMYLPMAGLAPGAAALGGYLYSRQAAWRPYARPAVAALVLLMGTLTIHRNHVWRNEGALWEDSASKAPLKARPLYNLGLNYLDQGRQAEALPLFERAAQASPGFADAWHNAGVIHYKAHQYGEAAYALRKALDIAPEATDTLRYMASASYALGRRDEALGYFMELARLGPGDVEAMTNAGSLLGAMGRHEEAIGYLTRALRLDPANEAARRNIALSYDALGMPPQDGL